MSKNEGLNHTIKPSLGSLAYQFQKPHVLKALTLLRKYDNFHDNHHEYDFDEDTMISDTIYQYITNQTEFNEAQEKIQSKLESLERKKSFKTPVISTDSVECSDDFNEQASFFTFSNAEKAMSLPSPSLSPILSPLPRATVVSDDVVSNYDKSDLNFDTLLCSTAGSTADCTLSTAPHQLYRYRHKTVPFGEDITSPTPPGLCSSIPTTIPCNARGSEIDQERNHLRNHKADEDEDDEDETSLNQSRTGPCMLDEIVPTFHLSSASDHSKLNANMTQTQTGAKNKTETHVRSEVETENEIQNHIQMPNERNVHIHVHNSPDQSGIQTTLGQPNSSNSLIALPSQHYLVIPIIGTSNEKLYTTHKILRYLLWLRYNCILIKNQMNSDHQDHEQEQEQEQDHEQEQGDANTTSTQHTQVLKAIQDGYNIIIVNAEYNGNVQYRQQLRHSLANFAGNHSIQYTILWVELLFNTPRPQSILKLPLDDRKHEFREHFKGSSFNSNSGSSISASSSSNNVNVDPADSISKTNTLQEEELHYFTESYVKIPQIFQFECVFIRGYLSTKIVFFLSNLHFSKVPLLLSRHGRSQANVFNQVGTDASLAPSGSHYAFQLANWLLQQPDFNPSSSSHTDTELDSYSGSDINSQSQSKLQLQSSNDNDKSQHITTYPSSSQRNSLESQEHFKFLDIYCSPLKRTIETATTVREVVSSTIHCRIVRWRALSEISAGSYDGMTYDEIAITDPLGFAERNRDKLNYKYPQGESYKDVIDRVERVIFELERAETPVLVIAHQAVIRCLLGYFLDYPIEDVPHLDVPLHHVIKIIPHDDGCQQEVFNIVPE